MILDEMLTNWKGYLAHYPDAEILSFVPKLIAVAKTAKEYQDKIDGSTATDLAHNWGPVYIALEELEKNE